ncbi:type III pantothenate kinase [Lachnospiraceae bacterium CLA-AA-H215]|uniref:Type III pantothenate kinase n=1 Tax=Hominifimenecus microfluidus TaxID=2885348 RepID=A0AAE3JH53_9FIRM|nr:type III pantothenate kinase [Hominifimenecus microfluidus]MCC2231491.1 type III pantothenate kinase [Hominifimenecus microfluidus]
MVFTIDIGNSNIVVGTVNRQGVLFVERMSTDHKKTELEYAILLKSAMEIHGITTNEIKGCIISSVVPPVTSVINRALEKLTGEKALVVGPGIRTGLNIKIDNPAQLGSDLVVDAVAGIAEYPLPLIIIDMGTATTMSAIDAAGNYLGGVIIPGVRVALDSMVSRTAQLPRISFEAPKKAIGKNTIECMKSGSVLGSASMLDGMIDRLEEELSQDATVVATGGIAPFITPHCKHKIICDDTLLLKGLYLIYNKNC